MILVSFPHFLLSFYLSTKITGAFSHSFGHHQLPFIQRFPISSLLVVTSLPFPLECVSSGSGFGPLTHRCHPQVSARLYTHTLWADSEVKAATFRAEWSCFHSFLRCVLLTLFVVVFVPVSVFSPLIFSSFVLTFLYHIEHNLFMLKFNVFSVSKHELRSNCFLIKVSRSGGSIQKHVWGVGQTFADFPFGDFCQKLYLSHRVTLVHALHLRLLQLRVTLL